MSPPVRLAAQLDAIARGPSREGRGARSTGPAGDGPKAGLGEGRRPGGLQLPAAPARRARRRRGARARSRWARRRRGGGAVSRGAVPPGRRVHEPGPRRARGRRGRRRGGVRVGRRDRRGARRDRLAAVRRVRLPLRREPRRGVGARGAFDPRRGGPARVPRAPRVVRVQAHGPVRAVRDGGQHARCARARARGGAPGAVRADARPRAPAGGGREPRRERGGGDGGGRAVRVPPRGRALQARRGGRAGVRLGARRGCAGARVHAARSALGRARVLRHVPGS